ncbi:MAG: DUF6364 family protein [Planctomycetota bacterium]
MPKLTLNADKDVIAKAKEIAQERGISVSTMFRQFVEMIGARGRPRRRTAPITRRLRGLAKVSPNRSDRELFEEALLAKKRR